MSVDIENDIILYNLITNQEYVYKVMPHMQKKYFADEVDSRIFSFIKKFVDKYSTLPSYNVLKTQLHKSKMTENMTEAVLNRIEALKEFDDKYDFDWLVDNTEQWVKRQAMYDAVLKTTEVIEDPAEFGNIQEWIKEAMAISFDNTIGLEFGTSDNIMKNHERYMKPDNRFSTGFESFDDILGGGLQEKTLTLFLAPTHAGKSMAKIALACNYYRQGYDVLYITLEMSEEDINQRIEANLFDRVINDIPQIKDFGEYKELYTSNIKSEYGRMVIKEYPTAGADTNTFRALINDLKLKLSFRPKIVFIDYLQNMNSVRVRNDNSYNTVKSIAEEVRGFMVENKFVGISSVQGNRGSYEQQDIDLTNTSESVGINYTADNMIGMIYPEELRDQQTQLWKMLKNRAGGIVGDKIAMTTDFEKATFKENKHHFFESKKVETDVTITQDKKDKKERSVRVIENMDDDVNDLISILDED
ncbi:DnaB-like helicase C-terminal domain-containing protein [uncultured Arcobacter sp.]|uniref:DnaB-like helicase C-terminal domain-containing protein n=1 Tax=uncultured Arcobacter sp. TaxID=165434 RepID=UPI00261872B0|nr:DnaB-like helicase C-terminal domain-containing protein [uncultured Arcobacter sp.]